MKISALRSTYELRIIISLYKQSRYTHSLPPELVCGTADHPSDKRMIIWSMDDVILLFTCTYTNYIFYYILYCTQQVCDLLEKLVRRLNVVILLNLDLKRIFKYYVCTHIEIPRSVVNDKSTDDAAL
ncbi:unnamed protein product [Aphis gossypii]|uniref:Uncharacterized protein n=1 Tax=Aphis gossypii TaxID=80765 RepID=A0A9P0J870_APHGO|nr:unnamed protein product [Aphis gossypii]